jgi:hypothetical protein
MFSGRRRDSDVWKYFDFIPDINKSKCTIVNEKTKKQCGALLAGKNPTNLKVHLSRHHEKIWAEVNEHIIEVKKKKAEKGKNYNQLLYFDVLH